MTSPSIGQPASSPVVFSPDYQRTSAPVIDNKAAPENTYQGNYVANPQGKLCASTAVTPIKSYLPVLKDVSWAIGLVAVIKELLDDSGAKNKFKSSLEQTTKTIDNNDFLPLTTKGFTLRIVQ